MCRIKVKVSELYEQVKLMKDDGMVYVTLSIFEEEKAKVINEIKTVLHRNNYKSKNAISYKIKIG